MHLDPDFGEFVESFNAHEVRYLVVGGHALAAHGLPRATGQFDAWVWVGGDNAERVLAALTAFGFGALGLEVVDFDHPDSIVQLGYPPYRIDILTRIDGVEFDDAWSHRLSIEVGCLPLELIGRRPGPQQGRCEPTTGPCRCRRSHAGGPAPADDVGSPDSGWPGWWMACPCGQWCSRRHSPGHSQLHHSSGPRSCNRSLRQSFGRVGSSPVTQLTAARTGRTNFASPISS